MNVLEERIGSWVLRWRWQIIVATMVGVALAASGARHLEFTNNYRVFFSEDNPELLAFEAMENTFTKSDNVMFTLEPENGNVFTRETLAAVEWITEQAWQTPFSSRVDSLSNFQHTEAQADDLVLRDLYTGGAELSDTELARVKQIAMHEPLLIRRLVSDRAHVTAINVTVQLPRINENVETPQVVAFARDLVEQIRIRYPHLQVYLPGMVMMNNAFSESSKGDLKSLVPISFGAMMLFLVILLKGFAGTAITVLVVMFSILTAMGMGGHFGLPLTPPSATAPSIILTMAIANCVHVLVTFLHHLRSGETKNQAISESLRVNLQPVFVASLTTAIGFLSMNFSEVPPFQDLGNFVAMGVATSFVLSVTFLPALVSLLPVRAGSAKEGRDEIMAWFGNFVVARRRQLFWIMAGLIAFLVASIPRNELNDVFVNYFDESVQFRVDSDFINENLTGLYRVEYLIESGEPGGINAPAFLKELEQFAQWYRGQPETRHVSVFTDTMLRLNKNMHGGDQRWYRLPEERELAAQYLLLYEMSLPYGLDLNDRINVDKSATRMTVSIDTISSNEVLALQRHAAQWLAENAPHIKSGRATGTTVMFANIGKRNIRSMLLGTTVALVMISFILIVALRSVRIGLVSLVPNLVPGAMGFGLWGLMVGEVGLALSVVTGMTLGIVVDDTVHFLSKYLRARREKGYSPEDAVRYAFVTVGRALVITSLVLTAGFLVLATSSFELNAGMGLLTAIVIVLALLADFLFLPALLIKLEEDRDEKAVLSDSASDSAPA